MQKLYTDSLLDPTRWLTREVRVGDLVVGGRNSIVIQSMTTPSTQDTKATVDQMERLARVGCQLMRVTTPTQADIDNLSSIRAEMKRRGITQPVVADVHFLPKLALLACDHVEKVRINPGNFADRKNFDVRSYSDQEYEQELERIREAFVPILKRAQLNGVALRIGTNHGSLSDRIMNRYGDTPLGMVESALEFVKIAVEESFHNLVLSMKASNTQVMIQAYRLLVLRMKEMGWNYPLHLGVTEAGEGEDGRIKSALGIGSLLADGLGDTIRVSLTEDPEAEIPVAEQVVKLFVRTHEDSTNNGAESSSWPLYEHQRRPSTLFSSSTQVAVGGDQPIRVRTRLKASEAAEVLQSPDSQDPPHEVILACDEPSEKSSWPLGAGWTYVRRPSAKSPLNDTPGVFDELSFSANETWLDLAYQEKLANLLIKKTGWLRVKSEADLETSLSLYRNLGNYVNLGFEIEGTRLTRMVRKTAMRLSQAGVEAPLHFHLKVPTDMSAQEAQLLAAKELGGLLCDGLGDSVEVTSTLGSKFNHRLAYNVLQASRRRMFKTEFISCPSCGRTLFDLQETTDRVRQKTGHLKDVKIAIMGCIVNGPGEMADADFGYVGAGPDRIHLYVGKKLVVRHIPTAQADDRLIELIREKGRWIDPK